MTKILFNFLFIFLLSGSIQAQISSETATPDKVIKKDKVHATKIDFGAGFAKGNSDYIEFSTNFLTFYNFQKYSVYFDGDINYRESNGEKASNSSSLTSRLDYHLDERWGLIFLDTIGHDEFTKVNFKFINGAGFLYDYKYENMRNGISLVTSYSWEKNIDHTYTKEAVFALRNEFYYKFSDYINFYCDFFYIPVVNDFSNFIIKLKPKLESKITDTFRFFTFMRIKHDSAPLQGVKLNDVMLASGFTLDL